MRGPEPRRSRLRAVGAAAAVNAAFNDPQSPWVAMIRGVFFGDAQKALTEGNDKIAKVLKE